MRLHYAKTQFHQLVWEVTCGFRRRTKSAVQAMKVARSIEVAPLSRTSTAPPCTRTSSHVHTDISGLSAAVGTRGAGVRTAHLASLASREGDADQRDVATGLPNVHCAGILHTGKASDAQKGATRVRPRTIPDSQSVNDTSCIAILPALYTFTAPP